MIIGRTLFRKDKMIMDQIWATSPGVHTLGEWIPFNMDVVEGGDYAIGTWWNVMGVKMGSNYLTITKTIHKVGWMMIAREIKDNSTMEIYIDGALTYSIQGPTAWEFTPPLKLMPGTRDVYITIKGVTAVDKVSLGGIRMWDTRPIECMFKDSTPFKQEVNTKTHDVIRGFTALGKNSKGLASSKFELLVYGDANLMDLVSNTNEVYVMQDEMGVWYRGLLEVSDIERVSPGVAYVSCMFKSPYMAGVGW